MAGKAIVTVVGATGTQGRSVINAVLKKGDFSVRAITRNPNSDKGKELTGLGVEVVKADLNDIDSLKRAFEGSYAIYGITDFFEPFGSHGPQKAMEIEEQQGVNLAKAAAATSTLEHYIWSTLPDGKTLSGGKYVVPHFEAKNQVDRYIKSDKALLAKTTFLWVTFYAANYVWPPFTPYEIPTAGKYVQLQGHPADTPIRTIGDVRTNVGIFVNAILAQPEKTQNGTFVVAHVEDTTAGDLLQRWAKATGKTAQYLHIGEKSFDQMWGIWSEEMGVMMQYWAWAREKSWSGEDNLLTKDDLGIKVNQLVGVEAAFKGLNL